MPWYLYLALKQLFPTGRRFPFFTAISVTGVALGVALLVVVMSVMGGFGFEIHRMIVDTQGEVQIHANQVIENSGEIMPRIAAVPGVAGVTPYAAGVGLINYNGRSAFPLLQGIDLQRVDSVVQLDRFIRPGSLADLDDDSIILSVQLAITIGARMGDKVILYTLPMIQRQKSDDEVMLPRELRVAGIFEIGHQQLDSSTALVTLRRMQDLLAIGHGVQGFNLKLAPGEDVDAAADRINAALPPGAGLTAYSWMYSFSDFLWVLQLEKSMIFFLLLFIVVVAAFSVTSSLLISVVRKTREIGLLGALGARPRQVAACFCAQGFLIGCCGTVFGLALGLGLLALRNDIVHLLARLTQREEVLQKFYQFSQLPAHTAGADLVKIVVFTILISTLAGLLPAWRAARLRPVEALRNE